MTEVQAARGGGFLRKMADTVVRGLTLTDPEGWAGLASASNYGSTAGPRATIENVLGLSTAWACVGLLAGTIASLPIKIYKPDGNGGRVEFRTHPLYSILTASPNADQSALDYWEFKNASIELRGNGYSVKLRGAAGQIIGLEPITPELVDVRRHSSGSILYRWPDRRYPNGLTDADVFHIRGFGGGPLGGLSTLAFGREAFGLALGLDRSAAETFANGLRPSGILQFAEWLRDDQRKIAREALENEFHGCMKAGRPLVLEGGQTWTQLTINPDDAQMLETRRFTVEEICRFFGVPPHLVGHTAGNTTLGSSIEQQTLAFIIFTLRRRLKRNEQAMEKQLLTPAERAAGVRIEYSLEGLLRGDTAARMAFYQAMANIGAMTINEIRALENLPPIEGGDISRIQMQNVPVSGAAGAAPKV